MLECEQLCWSWTLFPGLLKPLKWVVMLKKDVAILKWFKAILKSVVRNQCSCSTRLSPVIILIVCFRLLEGCHGTAYCLDEPYPGFPRMVSVTILFFFRSLIYFLPAIRMLEKSCNNRSAPFDSIIQMLYIYCIWYCILPVFCSLVALQQYLDCWLWK